jgi:hypothetical protein
MWHVATKHHIHHHGKLLISDYLEMAKVCPNM